MITVEIGTASHEAVAEHQAPTPPAMRIRYFNIAGVAWSNFKTGFNADGLALFMPYFRPFDVVSA